MKSEVYSLKKIVTIIGDSETSNEKELKFAEKLGEKLAEKGYIILTGGRGGIMEAVSRGAKKVGGITVAILPSTDKKEANLYIDIAIPTGIGWARNQIVVLSADVVIAIGGKSGTLSEIAYAWMYNKPIIAIRGFGGWSEKVSGLRIDDRRKDIILPASSIDEVLAILESLSI